jgi:AraC-like DNA-binding protein
MPKLHSACKAAPPICAGNESHLRHHTANLNINKEADMTCDLSDSYHFQVMRRAIDAINAQEQPMSLEQLAQTMGMSPAHFQRLFSQWVGVSPKRYQQYLALDHARRLLAERFTVLETSLASNLSGTGRLHDLFLRWEAMSPGDYAKGGAGLTIRELLSNLVFEVCRSCSNLVGFCGFNSVFERDACDDFG